MFNPLTYLISEVNWLAIIVVTVVNFFFGCLWYGPIFGKAWMNATGLNEDTMGASTKPMILTFILAFGTAIIIALAVEGFDIMYWPNVLLLGFGLGMALYAFNACSEYLWENRSMKLLFINAGFRVLSATFMGAVLSCWR